VGNVNPCLTIVRASFLDYHDTVSADEAHITLRFVVRIITGTGSIVSQKEQKSPLRSSILPMADYRTHRKITTRFTRDVPQSILWVPFVDEVKKTVSSAKI
jgi:hypothetical protein